LGSKQNYLIGKRDNGGFYLINFHPSGEPEAFICCVAKDSNQSSLFELRPDREKNYDVTLRSAFGGPMKASNSCKIQVLPLLRLIIAPDLACESLYIGIPIVERTGLDLGPLNRFETLGVFVNLDRENEPPCPTRLPLQGDIDFLVNIALPSVAKGTTLQHNEVVDIL
jgi:hypothetical protein